MKFFGHILLPVALSLMGTLTAVAQDHSISLDWGGHIPTGGGNFRNETSWIAPSVGWDRHILPWLSVGYSVGYGYAHEKGITRDRYDGAIVDGYSERKLSLVPVQARVRFFPLGQSTAFRPFVSVTGGVQYARFFITGETIQTTAANSWGGVFSAAAGVRYYPVRKRGFFIEASGGWQWAGNRFNVMNTKSQKGVEVRLGVGFSF